MEGKKHAAWCLLVVVVLLSTQLRPAAAESDFCICYKKCYADCRKDSGPYPCNFGCLQDCFNNDAVQPPTSAADCNRICQSKSICGVRSINAASAAVAAGDDDAQACLFDCRNSIGHSAPLKHTTTN